jgi:non-ribosomal peptide synthetase component E (peptide arylation enzyme)
VTGLRAHLEDHKVPPRILVTQGMPLLPNGKIDKNGLRRWVASVVTP